MRELNVVESLNVSAGSDNNPMDECITVAIDNAVLGAMVGIAAAAMIDGKDAFGVIKYASLGGLIGGGLGALIFGSYHATEMLISNAVSYAYPST